MNIVLLFATGTRAAMAGLFIAVISWAIVKQFQRIFPYLFYIIMIGNFVFVAIYIGLKNSLVGDWLNSASMLLFDKNLFSGRGEIWDIVIHTILQKPWLGYGTGVSASDVSASQLTAHNMYLQITLELGLVGLIVLFILLLSIWRGLMRKMDSFAAKWSACFMLGILVYESFELTLFENNFSVAFFQWLVMAFGIGFRKENDRSVNWKMKF
ncbi:O-antigen ligase family protein [Virgibacillus sp. 179-BFC.A HS]|uniref:O-antigen ligase family protein n=1 Tax=Tigheibacillus jepli TaxID=3035914 RepID=A0ABU5CES2_9BACI|nr:O-antigen ligase family protein [Virgibacillus sp. 179-BFC.A HS]MDY0404720.1 O-antigen ligase family protein [Virgibacillus sp. 179-BFC.A HS]